MLVDIFRMIFFRDENMFSKISDHLKIQIKYFIFN